MTFYEILVIIHILSAIVGLGPGFVLTYIVMKATNMAELRHGYKLRKQIHIFVMIGGTLLLVTGIIMGLINPYLFKQGWYIVSFILYILALAASPLLLRKEAKPINQFLEEYEEEHDKAAIPQIYFDLSKRLYLYEHLTNVFFLFIILLMILKPF